MTPESQQAALKPETKSNSLLREPVVAPAKRLDQPKGLRETMERIARTPSVPFPDAGAHGWEAFGLAVFGAWCDINRMALTALREDAMSTAETENASKLGGINGV